MNLFVTRHVLYHFIVPLVLYFIVKIHLQSTRVFSFDNSITLHVSIFSSAFFSFIATSLHCGILKALGIFFGILVLSRLAINALKSQKQSIVRNKSRDWMEIVFIFSKP